jgi:hypothetical protein
LRDSGINPKENSRDQTNKHPNGFAHNSLLLRHLRRFLFNRPEKKPLKAEKSLQGLGMDFFGTNLCKVCMVGFPED